MVRVGMGLIKNEHDLWCVRRNVPKHLEEAVATVLGASKSRQPWLKRSLRTKDEKRAKVLAKPVMMEFDRVIADAEALLVQQPSKTYGETVCFAGVMAEGEWKRLFPVRFRHLRGDSSFSRWDWIDFSYRSPTRDRRVESCHVYEDSITVDGRLPEGEWGRLLAPLITASAAKAMDGGRSLTLIRPRNTRFVAKKKSFLSIEEEREAYKIAAQQTSIFDKELAELEPSPFDFRFQFEDDDGRHDYQNGDWETHVMFWRWRDLYGEAKR